MYANILEKTLSNEILPDDVENWLRSRNTTNKFLLEVNQIEFVIYFLSYLRGQANFLETKSSTTPSSTPVKGTHKPPSFSLDPDSYQGKPRRSCSRKLPLTSDNKNDHSSYDANDTQGRRKVQQNRPVPQSFNLASYIVTKTSQRERKNARANIKLDSNIEFPEIGSGKKRIKPVMISTPSKCQQQENQAPNPFTSAPEVSTSDVALERALLKMECLKVQKKDMPKVCLDELTTLSRIYSSILNHDLELNFMNEVYFLTELLCVQIKPEEEKASEMFGNSRNCSFFAAKTLGSLKNFIEYLEPATMKLFCESVVLEEVCPEMVFKLRKILPAIQTRPSFNLNAVIGTQVENESRKNFSSPDSFQVYRKQRDTFYALLEAWDSERHFTKVLVKEVLAIFEWTPKEPENFAYFSRLFVSQLISSCIGDGLKGAAATPLQLQVDPVRLKKLQERLVTPAKALSGPCPPPEFSGWEEFFRDFIVIASNCSFNSHLQDAFVCRLHALNNSKFKYVELQSNVFSAEDETKAKFLACVLSAQLVAKFLGFLQFLPYRSMFKKLSEYILLEQLTIREKVNPVINTHDTLAMAAKNCRLTVTVPWLCSYLVQMDIVTLRMPYVQSTISLLASLQRSLSCRALPGASMLLVRLNIGWCLTILGDACPSLFEAYRSVNNFQNILKAPKNPDYLDMLDSKSVSLVCPFVSELRSLLAGTAENVKGSLSIGSKHITPIAAESVNPALQLELQLEESFIQTQPSSVRQTLTFVTERLTSLNSDFLETDIINPTMLELDAQVQAKVRSEANCLDPNLEFGEKIASLKQKLVGWSSSTSEEQSAFLLEKCLKEANVFILNRCGSLLKQLLPRTVSEIQTNAFAQIIRKNICAKLKASIQTNHGLKTMQKRVKDGVEKTAKQIAKSADSATNLNASMRLPADRTEPVHLESALSPAYTLISIKELILQMVNLQPVAVSKIHSVFTAVERAICHRADLLPDAYCMFKPLTVDLAIWIVATQPETMTEDLTNNFCEVWSGPLGRPDQLDRVFCPRYMQLLCDSHPREKSCAAFKTLLRGLLAANLLTPEGVEQQAVGIFRLEWPQEFLQMYSLLMKDICRDRPGSDNESFTPLLPWLADYCSDLDNLPGD
ncbi:codanin-1 isoform X1 [Cloeon dipterum]|uniref:codanin-1 isoform X1 n=1 Tax=Cloeon dipterum TaxID=197152 RepID=UPI0032202865